MASSNKPKQFRARNKNYKDIQVGRPKIDKVSVVYYLPSAEEVPKFLHRVRESRPQGIAVSQKERGRATALTFRQADSIDRKFLVDVQGTPEDRRIRFEFNPSNLTERHWNVMDGMICAGFALPSFSDFLSIASITQFHVCRDIQGLEIETAFFKAKGMRARDNFKKNHEGVLQTIDFGVPSGNQFTIYNKTEERGLSSVSHGACTRVEYKHRISPAEPLAYMLDFQNPFPKLEIYGLDMPILSMIPEQYFVWFIDSCRFRGVNNALKVAGFDSDARAYAGDKLKERVLPLWVAAQKGWSDAWVQALKEARLYEAVLKSIRKSHDAGEQKGAA